jgi:hypothetical protein
VTDKGEKGNSETNIFVRNSKFVIPNTDLRMEVRVSSLLTIEPRLKNDGLEERFA